MENEGSGKAARHFSWLKSKSSCMEKVVSAAEVMVAVGLNETEK